tara:strand:+ start:3519 stop:5870 length:2352 start_codon:yes stop_codon:yes gene_type:complete
MKIKDYLFVLSILLIVSSFLFYKLINGAYLFTSGDSLSPIAVKNAIKLYADSSNAFPLWFPWILGGIPTVHSFLSISNYYFPHHLMLILYDFGLSWNWYFILHLIFGGLGFFKLILFFKQDKYTALFGSILFLLMPYLTAMFAYGHGSQMMTASYIPWIVLYMFKIYDGYKLEDFLLFSILIGLQLQRGHVQISYYTWMMIGLFFVINIPKLFKKDNINKLKLIKQKISLILSLIIGLGLSLSIYLPILNYSSESVRGSSIGGGAGLDYATQWSLSFKEMFTFIFPYSLGFGGSLYFGDFPFTDYPNYMSIFIIFLAFLGYFKSDLDRKYKIFFSLTIIFSLLISLGNNFIEFYKLFYDYLPYFNKFRVPAYILILTHFSILVLASFGFELVLKKIKIYYQNYYLISLIIISICYFLFSHLFIGVANTNISKISNMHFYDSLNIIFVLIISSTTIYFYSRDKINKNIFILILISVLSYDYFRINKEIISPSNHIPHKSILKKNKYIEDFKKYDPMVKYLKNDTSKYRIIDFVGEQNRWANYHIENINGYHPAKLNNYSLFINKINKKGYTLWPEGILKLLNVKYIILPSKDFNHASFTNLGQKTLSYFGQNTNYDGKEVGLFLYEYNNSSKRIFFTNKILSVKDKSMNDILDFSYNPEDYVYINDLNLDEINFNTGNRSSKLTYWSPDLIKFETNTDSDQFLILSEIFYKDGWSLKCNGDKHDIFEVNDIVRGVKIPKGENYFEMGFYPSDFKLGFQITKFILVLIVLAFIYLLRKRYYGQKS